MARHFVVTQETPLGDPSLRWAPIGSSLVDPSDTCVQEAVRETYSPGDKVPPLYLMTIVRLEVSQAVHVEVGKEPVDEQA